MRKSGGRRRYLYKHFGDYDDAIVWYLKAADKGDYSAAIGLSQCIDKQGKLYALRNRYANGKGDKEAGLELAYYHLGNKEYDEAMPIFTSLSKDFPVAAYWAGYCFEKKGDPAKAKYWYKKAESAGFVIPNKY